MTLGKLGIFAGQGDLPRLLMEACRRESRPYFLVGIEGNTPPEILAGEEHFLTQYGAVGATLEVLQSHGVDTLVMAGRMERPKLSAIKPDAKGAKLLARLTRNIFGGDDKLLRTITEFFEEEGFRIVGADEILGEARMPAGVLGQHAPTESDLKDIALGLKAAKALGALDVGQAVIVQGGQVLGVEAAEGTDALIARCAALRRDEPGGVLVKAKKPQQERRADLPSMGEETVRRVKEAGFAGIAMEAGESLILNRTAVVAAADAAGLFLYGAEVSA